MHRSKKEEPQKRLFFFGAVTRIRTGDLILTKDALYLLSYNSISDSFDIITRDSAFVNYFSQNFRKIFRKAIAMGKSYDIMGEKGSDTMETLLIVVDMQNDFVTGALGSTAAEAILPAVNRRIETAKRVVYTLDTHGEDYLSTQEGQKLPVPHCIKGTWGHALAEGLQIREDALRIEKPTFGSVALGDYVRACFEGGKIKAVELIGLCTDICVISNAMLLKACCPELPVRVRESCCAGVSDESHRNALAAMRVCQIEIV